MFCQVGSPETKRRTPLQARSRKRHQALLEAAALVFAERGFEAATTEEIAARAGTSIGSLYQFFPNKLALFEALAQRYLDAARVVYEQLLSDEMLERPWSQLLDTVIDGFAALQQSEPGFRAVWMNFQLYGVYAEADEALYRVFVDRTQALIAAHSPGLPPLQRRVVATLVVQVISAVLFLSARESPLVARKVVAELKTLLRRYLQPYAKRSGRARSR
jgi:AcrR family transcriptional regulator